MIKSKVIILLYLIIIFGCICLSQENVWSSNGPFEARIAEIAINPFNHNNILLGTGEYGIYYSDNAGDYWHHLDNQDIPTSVYRIKFHPTNPNLIYIATSQGLYKSIDSGNNWSRVVLPDNYVGNIFGFDIHPVHPNILFSGGFIFNFKSTNGGASWTQMDLPLLFAQEYGVDPINENRVYLITHSGQFEKTIYKSDDLGETWECIHNNLSTDFYALDLVIDAVDNNILYVGGETIYGNECECLAKSYDAGESWIDITPDSLNYSSVRRICISPLDHNTVFICTSDNGLLKSTDGGESWESSNGGLNSYFADNIVYDSLSGTWYLSLLYDGLFKSTDNGASWEKISQNIPHALCRGLAMSNFNSNNLFLATYFHLYKSNDKGESWDLIESDSWSSKPTYFTCNVITDPVDSNYIYGGLVIYNRGYKSEIYRSLDGGNTWDIFSDGLPDSAAPYEIKISDNNGNRRLFSCGIGGLYFSDDLGENWERCYDSQFNDVTLRCLDISPINPELLFICDNLGRVFRSIDWGDSWEQLNFPNMAYYGIDIKCHPENQQIVYISVYGNGLYKSVDKGDTWRNINNNIPYENGYIWLSGIEINPQNPDNIFVNSYHNGIFQSHNGGESWEALNNGLITQYSNAQTLIDQSDTNRIFIATDQQSVWSIYRMPTGIDENTTPLPLELVVNSYPNPFNAAARISFTLPEAGETKADIYDILGRHVATVVDSYLFPGNHNVIWRPESISSGQYYLHITHPNLTAQQKLLYIK